MIRLHLICGAKSCAGARCEHSAGSSGVSRTDRKGVPEVLLHGYSLASRMGALLLRHFDDRGRHSSGVLVLTLKAASSMEAGIATRRPESSDS